ncbi:3,4-dihydroxy-2-butanone-4-phosphate synthase [bacterium]|nr:3,4-dihydroxy-2-butanone-4-phosphate synthase [bacterium]
MQERLNKAIERLKNGEMVILVDDENRENEGDLCFAAQFSTPEKINFMAKHGRGLICLTLTPEWTDKLKLPLMVEDNHSRFKTGFTISIEAKRGISTGISAADRSHTILTAINENVVPEDLVKPGHIFPLRAKDGGVLVRTGQTEGSIDLARLSGLKPFGVICEIMNDDGTMARMENLEKFSKEFDIPIVTIEDIISFRLKTERLIDVVNSQYIETSYGFFNIKTFESRVNRESLTAFIKGDISQHEIVPVRVHKGNLMGDIFGVVQNGVTSLNKVMNYFEKEETGVLLYMFDDKSINSINLSTDEEDLSILKKEEQLRDFGLGAQILHSLGLKKIKLITENPKKVIGLEGYGIHIVEQISL